MQSARRVSLQKYEIEGADGAVKSQIEMPSGLWPAGGAPLSSVIENADLSDFPRLTVGGVTYESRRDLVDPDAFASLHTIYLLTDAVSTHKVIESSPQNNTNRVMKIQFEGETFILKSRSFFGFKYELTQNEFCVARFKEVTPFLNFSVKRAYSIECGEREIVPLLLVFAFFLAVITTY